MEQFEFIKAQAVWIKGRETEKNLHLSFRTGIENVDATILHLTGSTVYRIFVNGQFIAIGPARTASGYYKVDSYDLNPYLTSDNNVLVIEVIGYNVNSYYTLDQPSFLTAEVVQKGEVVTYTGGDHFTCQVFEERVQKVQRYSFQRPFAESYRLTQATQAFRTSDSCDDDPDSGEILSVVGSKTTIVRDVRYPEYEVLVPDQAVVSGSVDLTYQCESILEDRSYINIGDTLKGYVKDELEEHLSKDYQNMSFDSLHQSLGLEKQYKLADNSYRTFAFPFNATGMIAFKVECEEPTVIYGLFDEILLDDDVDATRMASCNCVKLSLDSGSHDFVSFEPYTMKYLKLAVTNACTIKDVRLIEYKHPPVSNHVKLPVSRPKLQKIYDAALETYLSNSVDTFSDCPSRERAGWLCDSFFTARVEKCLTGKSILERSFLENFIIAKDFPYLPEGMLPMCYPADHYDGTFIPNWAMWFVLQLNEYFERSGDRDLIEAAKVRVYDLLKYFGPFVNELGLLENLESWVFIEWSKAADFVQNINYPSNMIYACMLEAIGNLYNDEHCTNQSNKMKETIRLRSYNGQFFTDNELRENGKLVNPDNTSEVCQYYAFFTGVATQEFYPDLWETLVDEYGPQRKLDNSYPKVHFANAFIGNYLRLELLFQQGLMDQLLDEVEDYFYNMAVRTGTLWEHDTPEASCNHGFASHIIYWLAYIYEMNSPS